MESYQPIFIYFPSSIGATRSFMLAYLPRSSGLKLTDALHRTIPWLVNDNY